MDWEPPHLWNCSQYPDSTIHTCMNVEPPIQEQLLRFILNLTVTNPEKVYFTFFKIKSVYFIKFDLLLNFSLSVETFAVLTKADKL